MPILLHEPADAVLRVARRVKARGFDAADLDLLAVGGRKGHAFRVLACPDGGLGIEGIALGVVSWKGKGNGARRVGDVRLRRCRRNGRGG